MLLLKKLEKLFDKVKINMWMKSPTKLIYCNEKLKKFKSNKNKNSIIKILKKLKITFRNLYSWIKKLIFSKNKQW